MNFLVTGGNGFLGSHVVDLLIKNKNKVFIIDRNKNHFNNLKAITFIGDILDEKLLLAIFKQKIDYVLHFAGIADINIASNNPISTVNNNILSTVKLLEISAKNNVQRFIFASSIYVYSNEGSFYKSSKIACESYVREFYKKYKLPFTIIRYGSLYGPRSDNTNGLHRILQKALKKNEIIYEGDPESMREFINVKDAAEATIDLLSKQYLNQNILLSGNGLIKIEDLLKTISEIMNISKKIKFIKNRNVGHYIRTPYNYSENYGKKYSPLLSVDLGQGILELIEYITKLDK